MAVVKMTAKYFKESPAGGEGSVNVSEIIFCEMGTIKPIS